MKKCINGKMVEMTAEEIEIMKSEAEQLAAEERHRPMTESEVTDLLIRSQINSIDVDDQTALRMRSFYPEWVADTAYDVGYKVQYGNKLYKVTLAHTSQEDWTPDTAVTLYEVINETHDGTKYDPIPYSGNMVLEEGLYYRQDGVVYRCVRDTVNPVYNALADLVGVFVEATV